jgi:BTB/POZ domain
MGKIISPFPQGWESLANLTLHVGKRRFAAVREILCLASPVFNAMLHPQGRWNDSTHPEVAFPEDDPEAFEIALQIIHHRIPSRELDFDQLLSLSVLSDKYDLAHLTRRFVQTRLQKISIPVDFPEALLHIGWTYGLKQLVERSLRILILFTTSEDGRGLALTEEFNGEPRAVALELIPNVLYGEL